MIHGFEKNKNGYWKIIEKKRLPFKPNLLFKQYFIVPKNPNRSAPANPDSDSGQCL